MKKGSEKSSCDEIREALGYSIAHKCLSPFSSLLRQYLFPPTIPVQAKVSVPMCLDTSLTVTPSFVNTDQSPFVFIVALVNGTVMLYIYLRKGKKSTVSL